MSIELGAIVVDGGAGSPDRCLARLRAQPEPVRTLLRAPQATPAALTEVSHVLILTSDLVLHPYLLRWSRRALGELFAFGTLAAPSSERHPAEAYDGTPAAYQRLLCTARRIRPGDPVSCVAVPRELWLAHRGEGLTRLARRLEEDPRSYLDRSGFLAVRRVCEEVGSKAPPVPLAVPRPAVAGVPRRISVVMPVRDRAVEHLRASVAAWLAQSLPPAEVVVVDQKSAPAQAAAYRELAREVPALRLLRCEQPERWNKPMALNHGIRATDPRSSHVLATDCDLLFHPEALATLSSLVDDDRRFLHGHRCDLPDLPGELRWIDGAVWDEWSSAAKVVDAIADPWHLMPRKWAFEVRGYDERMFGWGCHDTDFSARAGRALETLRLGPGRLVALHYPHPRSEWAVEADTPDARRSREIFNTDPSIVRNAADWGVRGGPPPRLHIDVELIHVDRPRRDPS